MKLGPVARSVALTSSRRALAPGLPASQGQRRARNAFSTRHALRKPADGAENVTTDDKQRHPFPSKLPPTRESKGPEYIKGDEGSHGQRTLKSFCMAGKTCVVTGGARGLGNLMGRALVESGCNQLAILDRKADEAQAAAEAMTQWMENDGGVTPGEIVIRGFACDVANEPSVQNAFKEVKAAFGKVDTVINSAGIVENFPATEYPADRLEKLYAINVFGSHYVSREAAKLMIADNIPGSIILVASMSATVVNVPQPQAPYNASKAAVKHLGACLAVEWAKHNIRVNTLSPGYMLTSLLQAVLDKHAGGKELRASWEAMTPAGRLGMPEDLKGAAVYLASDASRFTTGSDLVVDGGYSCP